MVHPGNGNRTYWYVHGLFWLVVLVLGPLGLWAYRGAALDAEFATLMSFCTSIAR